MSCYPITDSARALLDEQLPEDCVEKRVLTMLVDALGEYEHGTADVYDVNPLLTVRALGDVVKDQILTVVSQL